MAEQEHIMTSTAAVVENSWGLAERVCTEYMTCFMVKDTSNLRFVLENQVGSVMRNDYGTPPPEVFAALLEELFNGYPLHWSDPVSPVIVLALKNPACPTHLLAYAAVSQRQTYEEVSLGKLGW
jgi:hypothetical protein